MSTLRILLLMTLCFPLFATKESELALHDPNSTFIVQANFAYFLFDKENPMKAELRLFNLEEFAYFIRPLDPNTFGYLSFPDLVDLWTEKGGIFSEDSPEAIILFYLTSTKYEHKHGDFAEVALKIKNPYLNTLTDNLTFDVELLKQDDSIPRRGELFEVTLIIN